MRRRSRWLGYNVSSFALSIVGSSWGQIWLGGGKGEMGRIYLNPTGPQGKGSRGPRSKRMFVSLPATQRAAQVMSDGIAPFAPSDPNSWSKAGNSRHYNEPDVSSVGVVMSNHYEPLGIVTTKTSQSASQS